MADERLYPARQLDDKGRCCGRKPFHYKGGSWRSPPGAPLLFCCGCCREYDPATGKQRASWAYLEATPGFYRLKHEHMATRASK